MRALSGYLPDSSGSPAAPFSPFSDLAPHLVAASPAAAEYHIPEFLPAFDQGNWGSCVCNAWIGCLEVLRGLEFRSRLAMVQPLSIAWLYFQCRNIMGTVGQDSGTYPYLAADRLMKVGTVPNGTFPYVSANMPPPEGTTGPAPAHPGTELYVEASDNKITGAFKIDDAIAPAGRLDAIEHAVRANHPVVWGASFSVADLSNWDPSMGALDIPTNPDGGHSTLITGVRRFTTGRRWFRVRNSWSPQWGDNGYFWITDNYVASNLASDFWVGTRMQGLVV
jgi:hypothetical protein